MSKLLLSIAIPTYNRADCLKQCLNSIVSQFSDPEVFNGVEVVISNNASTDNTEALVRLFQEDYPNVKYNKNPENLGVDKNILRVVEMSQGGFVMLLGDDDALFPGYLSYLVKLLRQNPQAYYLSNCWGYNKSLTEKALNHPNFSITDNQNYASTKEYVRQAKHDDNLVGLFCGLSGQIFLRQPWMDFSKKENFIGTSAIHLHILMSVMKDRAFALLAKPGIMARSDNIRWETFEGLNSFKTRAQNTEKALLWILKEYSLPYSRFRIRIIFAWYIFSRWLRAYVRNHLLKSQKSRDMVKRLLGKL